MEFKNKKLVTLKESSLRSDNILERYDLQEAIISSWEEFKTEINMPQLSLIGSEIRPHSSVQNSIDILAFDSIDSAPVVIELKRDKNKLQLLQAISYASMVATWSVSDYVKVAKSQKIGEVEDLENDLNGIENEFQVKIILIAEKFDPEVIISCDWLCSNFNLDISTISLEVFTRSEETYFRFSQTYPLPELKDTYEARAKLKKKTGEDESSSWGEIKKNLKYDWGKPILEAFLKHSLGDTKRKRFSKLACFGDIIPFESIGIGFCEKWIRVYVWGKPENAEEIFRSVFGENSDIGEWRDGYSIKLHTNNDGKAFMRWLQI